MNLDRADSGKITPEARQKVLAAYGLTGAEPIAVGMEAEVYDYDAPSLLKIYADVSRLHHFETLRDFYEMLDTSATNLTLPKIRAITQHDNLIATIESRVPGVPLESKLGDLDAAQHDQAENLYLDAVFQLRQITLKITPKTYLLFDRDQRSLVADQRFNSFYADFLEQKLAQVGPYFASSYPAFEPRTGALVNAIRQGKTEKLSVVHGDFFPGNLLVDEAMSHVHGVIDFGAFTLIGNYLLDIGGAFGFYRMYDPHRVEIRRRLLSKICERLTYPEQTMFFQYLLAHAILTSDLYASQPDPRGDDHFRWATEIVSNDAHWAGALP